MRLPSLGVPRDTLFAQLEAFKAGDLDWRKGRTWAYVYPAGDDVDAVAKHAYTSFLTENALDPTVFPSVMQMENQIVAIAASHLRGGPGTVGNFTSGGTESILLMVKAMRDRARATRPRVRRPNLVLPVTAHAAFHKACAYFDVEARTVPVDRTTFRASADAYLDAIDDDTILLVASAPSYAHGVIDDIPAIGRLAKQLDLPLHVDACVGGWLLPYFRRLGAPVPDFDFAVEGVTSMSMDLHKFAFCAKGASIILYRSEAYRQHQFFACSGWTGYTVVNSTFQSTKSGGPVAAAWAVLHHLGDEGYLRHARRLLDATRALVDGCRRIPGIRVLGEPAFTMVAIAADDFNVFHVADEMRARGWYVQPQLGFRGYPPNVHFTVNPGVADAVAPMLADLGPSVEAARLLPKDPVPAAARRAIRVLGGLLPAEADYAALLGVGGVGGGSLPTRMAEINAILEALPTRVREALLKRYLRDLNRLHEGAEAPATPPLAEAVRAFFEERGVLPAAREVGRRVRRRAVTTRRRLARALGPLAR